MDHIILVCGKWKFERKKKWLFEVDNDQGSKLLAANEETRYEDFVKIIYEDYEVDFAEHELELTYVLPKRNLVKENLDTPPVKVRNDRQFHGFLCLHKVKNVRLCVEFKLKKKEVEEASKEPKEFLQKNDPLLAEDEDSDEDNDRFDYCDDSDGATSDDENFTSYGFPPDQVQESQGSPTKMSSATVLKTPKENCTHNRFDLSSFKLEVGQSFDSKDALATRLKICSVVHKFDFDVDKSTRTLWFVKCWVKGCTWKLRATPVGESSRFTIRVYVDEHSCSVTERSSRSRQATPEILGLLYKDYIGGVDRTILPRHVESAMNMSFGIKVC